MTCRLLFVVLVISTIIPSASNSVVKLFISLDNRFGVSGIFYPHISRQATFLYLSNQSIVRTLSLPTVNHSLQENLSFAQSNRYFSEILLTGAPIKQYIHYRTLLQNLLSIFHKSSTHNQKNLTFSYPVLLLGLNL